MPGPFQFLRIYRNLATRAPLFGSETEDLYFDLKDRVNGLDFLEKSFASPSPDNLDILLAIDSVAHAIHQKGNSILQHVYPGTDLEFFKKELDQLAGLEKENEIRQFNRGYFTTLLSKDGLLLLEKQAGRTTKDDITEAIELYKKLFKAGMASPAEILTLARYYEPQDSVYKQEVTKRHLDDDEVEPLVVGGPASVEMIDKQGHLITSEALKKAFDKFMLGYPRTNNISVFHCLHPDTKVLVQNKTLEYIKISDVKIGQKVLTHTGTMQEVKQVMSHDNEDEYLMKLTLKNNEVIRITSEHTVLTKSGWKMAQDLNTQDVLLTVAPLFLQKGIVNSANGKRGKTLEEYYGIATANKIKQSISTKNAGRPSKFKGKPNIVVKGKTMAEIMGSEEKAKERALKISLHNKGKIKNLSSGKHNSHLRKGKTWAEVYGEEKARRKNEKHILAALGNKNPNWKGGLSFLPYASGFNKITKTLVRERDNYICQRCGKTESEELQQYRRKLSIHHIDYDKLNCNVVNLIALCDRCNSLVNTDRARWTQYFQEKIVGMIQNGMQIVSIEKEDYKGKVYNLEIENISSYVGKGIIFHNSDVQAAWAMPAYINKTGEIFKSEVDDKGLWVVSEIRGDTKIAKKVQDEIKNGTIKSYSIAGSATKTQIMQKGARIFTQVDELELQEIALCIGKFEKVWTKNGLMEINTIKKGDLVLTHKLNWKPVTQVLKRSYNGNILKITTETGSVLITDEHPIRLLTEKSDKTCHYRWVNADTLKVGDIVSSHIQTAQCVVCNAPIFNRKDKYCNRDCLALLPNRKGKTIASGDSGAISHSFKTTGITKKDNPRLKGGRESWKPESHEKQRLAVTSLEFREKRSQIQKALCQNEHFRQTVLFPARRKAALTKLHNLGDEKYRLLMKRMMLKTLYRRGQTISNEEKQLNNILQSEFSNQWKFVGDWSFNIGTKCPDFISCQGKKVIELWGNYWHRNDNPRDRIEYFKQYGYDCLIIWAHELRDVFALKNKIAEFVNNKFAKVIAVEKVFYSGDLYNLEVDEDNSYVTEAAVVHNCEKGVNQGAMFDILKSEPKEISQTDFNSLLSLMAENSLSIDGFAVGIMKGDVNKIILYADSRNEITEAIVLKLSKQLPLGTIIELKTKELAGDTIPIYKMELVPIGKNI